ncbi:hypothetical protein ACSVH2_10665 [Flavobacterium sp. RSB2_4_14]|uniref:hypothetical protein n=1 Tax=Flavobacterium sp. RSB2_4_14 TaxID=3447665 RepID=UPI003F39397D
MNKNVLKIGLFSLVLLGFTSCNKKENDLAEQRISELERYVDSLKTVSDEDMKANWDKISEDFEKRNAEASEALANLDEETKSTSQVRITTTTTYYDQFKKNMEPKPVVTPSPSQLLRDRLFGAGKIGDDMSFAWVNKDNILNVYENFFQSYKDNKGDFSREDYDEIKLMYEALDSRKNTVEKEGLSNDDNMKISSIKFKFSPMFKMNRMGAKNREATEAKE